MPWSSIIKLLKTKTKKKKTLKASREKWHFIQRETLICRIVDFLYKTMEASRKWSHSFKVLRGKNYQPRILYLMKTFFRNEDEIKAFSMKENRENLAP